MGVSSRVASGRAQFAPCLLRRWRRGQNGESSQSQVQSCPAQTFLSAVHRSQLLSFAAGRARPGSNRPVLAAAHKRARRGSHWPSFGRIRAGRLEGKGSGVSGYSERRNSAADSSAKSSAESIRQAISSIVTTLSKDPSLTAQNRSVHRTSCNSAPDSALNPTICACWPWGAHSSMRAPLVRRRYYEPRSAASRSHHKRGR